MLERRNHSSFQRVTRRRLDEVRERAGDDASSRLDRHARRVVPAVLEPAEAFQQDRRRVALADVAHDAAHTLTCPPRLARAAVWASLPARTGPTRTTCPASVP